MYRRICYIVFVLFISIFVIVLIFALNVSAFENMHVFLDGNRNGKRFFYVSSDGEGSICSERQRCSLREALKQTRSDIDDYVIFGKGIYGTRLRTRADRVTYTTECFKSNNVILQSVRGPVLSISHSNTRIEGLVLDGGKENHCVRIRNLNLDGKVERLILDDNIILRCAGPGIQFRQSGGGIESVSIRGNTINRTGYKFVGGGIYLGQHKEVNRIKKVDIKFNSFKNFTDNCLDIKRGVSNVDFRFNICERQIKPLDRNNRGTIVVRGEKNRIMFNQIKNVNGGIAVFRVTRRGGHMIKNNYVARTFCTDKAVARIGDPTSGGGYSLISDNVFVQTPRKMNISSKVKGFNVFESSRDTVDHEFCRDIPDRQLFWEKR